MGEPCHGFRRGVQVRPCRFAPARPHSGGLGPIGTHIGILLPGLRPVIARFSAISHGRLCAPSSGVATLRQADGDRPARGLAARLIAAPLARAFPHYDRRLITAGYQKRSSPAVLRCLQTVRNNYNKPRLLSTEMSLILKVVTERT